MRKILVLGSFLAGAVLFTLRGIAQDAEAEQALQKRFRQLDKNGDGQITTAELPLSTFFRQRDANGDGAITLAEAMAHLGAEGDDAEASASQTSTAGAGKVRSHTPLPALRQGPQPLRGGDHGVGRQLPDATFQDLGGKTHRLGSFSKQRLTVIAMTSTSCPVSKKYFPTLVELAAAYSNRGVAWILANPQATDKPDEMRAAAEALHGKSGGGTSVYVPDAAGELVKAVGTLTTTDVVVIDAARTVVYHGAIDDQYGQGYAVDAPRYRYLADALDALLAGRQPDVAATSAPGCTLDVDAPTQPAGGLTYHGRISRIVQAHCVECHRDGGVAPFPLTSYDDVLTHAAMIKQVVEQGVMPPWFAAPHDEVAAGGPSLWANDRSLAAADKVDLLAWLRSDKPEGDKRDAPQPRSFASGWQIGKPDAVFEYPDAVKVKATGIVPYESVVIETHLSEDKWIDAIEVQPGNRSVVHHMLVFLQPPGRMKESPWDDTLDELRGFWAIYVPGNATLEYPEGFAKRLPKGARLRCQVHYTTTGTETSDRSRIGVRFAKRPPRHEVHVFGIVNHRIEIPPGAGNHREEASLKLPFDIQVLSFLPHMHLRGAACRYKVVGADAKSRALLDVPRYDFNWQLLYRYHDPQPVARGETIKYTAWYDNSDKNPANPDPTRTARWGRQLSDEMHLGYFEFYIPGHKPGEPLPMAGGGR